MLELKSFLASRQYTSEEKFFLTEGSWLKCLGDL